MNPENPDPFSLKLRNTLYELRMMKGTDRTKRIGGQGALLGVTLMVKRYKGKRCGNLQNQPFNQ